MWSNKLFSKISGIIFHQHSISSDYFFNAHEKQLTAASNLLTSMTLSKNYFGNMLQYPENLFHISSRHTTTTTGLI